MIDRLELRKMIRKGDLGWGDISSSESLYRSHYNSGARFEDKDEFALDMDFAEEEGKKTTYAERQALLSDSSKVSVDSKKEEAILKAAEESFYNQPEPKAQKPNNYSWLNGAADSYKGIIINKNEASIAKHEGVIKNDISPIIIAINSLNPAHKDPEFYEYLAERKRLNSVEAVTEIPKDILNYNNLSPQEKDAVDKRLREKEEAALRKKNALENPGNNTFGDFLQNVGESLKRVVSYGSSLGSTLVGDVASMVMPGQTLIDDSDDYIIKERERLYNEKDLSFGAKAKSAVNAFGEDHALGIAAGAYTAMGMPGAQSLIAPAISGVSNIALGYAAYRMNDQVNTNLGYRDVLEEEIPVHLREAHKKYDFTVSNISRGGKYKEYLPDLDAVADGKAELIDKKKLNALSKEINKDILAELEGIRVDREDLAHLKFMGIDIGPISEYAKRKREEDGYNIHKISANLGSSIVEVGTTAAITAGTLLTSLVVSRMAKLPWGNPVKLSAVAGVVNGIMNAYGSSISRGSEYLSSFSAANSERQDEYLKGKLGKSLSEMSYEELIAIVDKKDKNAAQFISKMNSSTATDDDKKLLEFYIRAGLVDSSNPEIVESIKYAEKGSDEMARQDNSMLYADMWGNTLINSAFYVPNIAKYKKTGFVLSKAFGEAADDAANYLLKNRLSVAINKTVAGRAARVFGKVALGQSLNVFKEAAFEENPQFIIEDKYKRGVLSPNSTALGVLKDTYSSAITGTAALVGMSGDPRYDNNPDLIENAISTIFTTLVMGGLGAGAATYSGLNNIALEEGAKKFVTGNVISQMKMANREAKTDVYIRAMSQGKQDKTLEFMTSLLNNLPEGIGREELEEEIALARTTMAIANNKNVVKYANRSAGFGSTDHKLLTSLIVDHISSARDARTYADEKISKFDKSIKADYEHSQFKSFIDNHNETAENKISDEVAMQLFDAKAKLEALDLIQFRINPSNQFGQNKKDLFLKNYRRQYSIINNAYVSMLSNAGLISEDDVNNQEKLDELSELMPGANSSESLSMAEAFAALIGARYDTEMSERLGGVNRRRGGKQSYDIFVDKHLDAYRAARREEEEEQMVIEEAVKLRKEVIADDKPAAEVTEEPILQPILTAEEAAIARANALLNNHENKEEIVDPKNNELAEDPNLDTKTRTRNVNPNYKFVRSKEKEEDAAEAGDVVNGADDISEPEAIDEEKSSEEPEVKSDADNTKEANEKAAESIFASAIIDNVLELEDSQAFYEIEEDFPGSTEAAPVDIKHDKLSRTLFTSNRAAQQFLMLPDALEGVNARITVSRIPENKIPKDRLDGTAPNQYLAGFDINNPLTWDEAWIEVEITSKKHGVSYKYNISLPDIAENRSMIKNAAGEFVNKFSESDIVELKKYRAQIISEALAMAQARGKKKLVAVGGIVRGKAKISLNRVDGKAVQRPLHKIKGLIPEFTGKNWGAINKSSVKLAYGRGAKGVYDVVGLDGFYGHTQEQNSGSIFIVMKDPLTGSARNIKINKLRIKDDVGAAELIYKLVVDFGASRSPIDFNRNGELEVVGSGSITELGLTPSLLLNKIVSFGDRTIVSEKERELFAHLIPKQFYIDGPNLIYGENVLDISNPALIPAETKAALIEYIKDNFHWSISKTDIWNAQGNDNKVSDLFPQLRTYFNNNKSVKSIKISDGFEIGRDELGLTWTGWLIKNGKLISDVADGVFDAPYIYLNDVRATLITETTSNPSGEIKASEGAENASEGTSAADVINNKNNEDESATPKKKKSLFGLNSNKKINVGKPRRANTSASEYTVIDAVEESKWLKDKLGASVDVVDDVISIAEFSSGAMGLTTADSVMLWEGAEEGTGYHEGFHRLSLLLFSRVRRMVAYEQVRKSVDGMADATNSEIEEYIAEDFRAWKLNNKGTKRPSMISNMFRVIYNFISSARKLGAMDLTRLYSDIDRGIFKGKSINNRSLKEFKAKYDNGATKLLKDKGFSAIKTLDLQYALVDGLTFALFDIMRIRTVSDIRGLNDDRIEWKEELRDYISGTIDELNESDIDGKERTIEVYKDVLDKFDSDFVPMIKDKLISIGISIDESIEDDLDNIVSDEMQRFFKSDYEISKKDNIPVEIKFFISTIQEMVQDEDGSYYSETHPITMLNKFVDPGIAWKKMIDDLHEETTVDAMLLKISELANKKNNPFYFVLQEKLAGVDQNFLTKLWTTMYSHKHEFINFSVDPNALRNKSDKSVRPIEAKLDDAKTKLPKVWGENAIASGFLFTASEDGLTFNKDNAEIVFNKYVAMSKAANGYLSGNVALEDADLEFMFDEYVSLFGLMGIDANSDTFNSIIEKLYPNENRQRSIAKLITNPSTTSPSFLFSSILNGLIRHDGKLMAGKREKLDKKDIYKSEKSIKNTAEAYAKVNPSPQEIISIGADGAKVYEIALRNYILDLATKLKKDKSFLDKLKKVTYIAGRIIGADGAGLNDSYTGSLILDQLINGKASAFEVKTFLKFYQEKSGDPGRDYFKIGKAEDYVLKMAAAMSGYMVFPTMADKKTYYLVGGFKLPDFSANQISYDAATGSMSFPTESLNIFNDYFYAEYETMKSAWNKYVEVGGDKNKLIDVYHFGGVNQRTGKKWKSGLGNGMKFRHFDILRMSISGQKPFDVNLNELMEDFISRHGLEEGMEAFFTFMDKNYFGESVSSQSRLTIMNNTMKSSLLAEIKWAENAGLIKMDGGVLTNLKLDAAIFDKTYNDFLKSNASIPGVSISDAASTAAVLNMMAANLVNTSISNIEFDKLISKDSAFYKDFDAKMKRHSSILSTGTNLRVDYPAGHELHGKNTFVSAELNDNEMFSPQFDELKISMYAAQVNELLRQSGETEISNLREVYSNEAELADLKAAYPTQFSLAEKIIDGVVGGYGKSGNNGNINETDATVFVSPAMYKSMLMRLGKWDDSISEAFKLLESDDLSWMTDDAKYLQVMDIAMNPLKMIYFGDNFVGDLNVPKLDKMAMFCLFKAVATGDLGKLYDRMNSKELGPIDMVAFKSAVKVGNNHPQDFYSDSSNDAINDLSNLATEEQFFEYLRHQLVTDAHQESAINIATQVQKIGMSNIIKDKVYSNISIGEMTGATGEQVISEWRSAISELSSRGAAAMEKEFGISKNDDGSYDASPKKVYEFLIKEARKSNMPSDVIEMFESYSDENLDNVSLQAMMDNAWVESKITSYVMKKTIDIEAPGGMFIQMSAFGMKSIDDKNEEYVLNGGKRLNFLNHDGSMDSVVSLTLFKDIIPEDIKRKSPSKQRDWLLMHNIIGENSNPAAIGYRIPTQGLSSVSALRIVDVIASNIGDTIILPSEFTKLTGSDFDIDKLYLARYNYKKGPSGRVEKVVMNDSSESKWKENSSEAIQNRLIDCLMAIITEPSSIHETRTPLDTVTEALKSDVLEDIESLLPKNVSNQPFKFLSPSYQTDKKIEYSTGKRNLAPFALANTNHVLTQIAGTRFKNRGPIKKFGLDRLDKVYGQDSIRILDWLSAMINAHVDIAKDPYIIRLGINENTIKMASFLLRTGVGKNTFYFLSQPIMRELYSEMGKFTGEYGISEDTDISLRGNIDKIITKYKNKALEVASDSQKVLLSKLDDVDEFGNKVLKNSHSLDFDNLREGLKSDKSKFFWWYNQILALETFNELSPFANELAELVKYSQIDTKKAGKSFAEQREFRRGMMKLISENSGDKGVFLNLEDFFNNTFIENKSTNSIGIIGKIGSGLLFRTTPSIIKATDRILTMIGRGSSDNRKILPAISKYIDSKIKSKFFIKYAEDNNIDINGLFFGENTVAKKLYNIKNRISSGMYPELESNEFLKNITYVMNSKDQSFEPDHITVTSIGAADQNLSEKIKNYFNELLNSSDTYLSDFAKEFIVYQFFSTGDNGAINTVKIAEQDRRDIGFYKFIAEELGAASMNDDYISNEDIADIFINRWYDNSLVPVKQNFKDNGEYYDEIIGEFVRDIRVFPSVMSKKKLFKNKDPRFEGDSYPVLWVDKSPTTAVKEDMYREAVFAPFVKIRIRHENGESSYVLYENKGTVAIDTKKGVKRYPLYGAIKKKGNKESGLSIIEHGIEESILRRNNIRETADMEMSKEGIEAIYGNSELSDLMLTFNPRTIFNHGVDPHSFDENEKPGVVEAIDMAIEEAVATNDYSISILDSLLDMAGISEESDIAVARAEYARAILSRFKDFENSEGTDVSEMGESGLDELKMRMEAYLQAFIPEKVVDAVNQSVGAQVIDKNTPATMGDITNHSGGAYGGDTYWDIIGREFGVINHNHYRDAGNANLSQKLRDAGVKAVVLTKEQMDFARGEIKRLLGVDYANDVRGNLQVRNFYQIYNADAVFAVSGLGDKNGKPVKYIDIDLKGVRGGTNTAVQLAIELKKPVYVFDIYTYNWYRWNGAYFEVTDTPILTKDFAGIGSRNIENYSVQKDGKWVPRDEYVGDAIAEKAKQAIRDVYQKTKDFLSSASEQPTISAINVYAGTEENAELSNMEVRSELGGAVMSNSSLTDETMDLASPIQEENNVPAKEVSMIEYGTTYIFGFNKTGEVVSGEYSQAGSKFEQLKSPAKTYNRLRAAGIKTNEEITSNKADVVIESVTPDNKEAADVTFMNVPLDLSKIGISFKLNDGQSAALNAVSEWALSDSLEPFSLRGYAGTGKSSITKIITSALKANKTPVVLAALTHKAKSVMARMTGKKATTIHALLKMQASAESIAVGKRLEFMDASSDGLPMNGIVIIDESSMVPNDLVDLLIEMAAMKNSKVLFIGDTGQLDPVTNGRTSSGSEQSKALRSENSAELTEVMRAANGNPLTTVATAMRRAQEPALRQKFGDIALSTLARRTAVSEAGGVAFLGEDGRKAVINFMVDKYYKSKEYQDNPSFVKYVAYRNSVVDSINDMVRAALGKNGIIEEGEIMSGQAKVMDSQGLKTLIENDDEYIVTNVSKSTKMIKSFAVPGVELKVVEVEIATTNGNSKGGSFYVLTDYSEENITNIQNAILKKKAEISEIYAEDRRIGAQENKRFYKSLMNDFITIKNIPNPSRDSEKDSDALKQRSIRHYHAITAHKAQGSEFDHVIVDDSDLRRIDNNNDGLIYKKALYTSVTRARTNAIVVTNGGRYSVEENRTLNDSESNAIPSEFSSESILDKVNKLEDRPSDKC